MANVLTDACDTIPGMSQRSDARGEDDRWRFVADPDVLAALDLKFEQLSDPDVRSVVIRHEHPEFEQALKEGRRQIEGADGPMNPRLHLKLHEIVATQLWDDSPPEVWDTAVRLLDAGYERHEILHMLARPVSDQIWEALHDERPYDTERHVAALDALPGSWERERTTTTTARRHDDARKQARRAQRERQGSAIDGPASARTTRADSFRSEWEKPAGTVQAQLHRSRCSRRARWPRTIEPNVLAAGLWSAPIPIACSRASAAAATPCARDGPRPKSPSTKARRSRAPAPR